MTKQDQKKLGVLVFLLGVLSLTIVLGYRMNQPPTTSAVQTPEGKAATTSSPGPSDARIRLDLVENPESSQDIGKRNLFQYQPTAPPPSPFPPQRGSGVNVGQSQPVVPTPVQRLGPPPGPQVQPIPFKYQGYAAMRGAGGNNGLVAFLADDARHYNVEVGEVLLGRYRIVSISDKSVEVEDLEGNRRQALPLLK